MWILFHPQRGSHLPSVLTLIVLTGQDFCFSQWVWLLNTLSSLSFAWVISTSWRCSSPFLWFVQILLFYQSLCLLGCHLFPGEKRSIQTEHVDSTLKSLALNTQAGLWHLFSCSVPTMSPLHWCLHAYCLTATVTHPHPSCCCCVALWCCGCPSDILWSPAWSSALLPHSFPCSPSFLVALNHAGWLWNLWMT